MNHILQKSNKDSVAIKSAQAILEWLELAETEIAADLAVSALEATISSKLGTVSVCIDKIEVESNFGLKEALQAWAHEAFRRLLGHDPESLGVFKRTFANLSNDRMHALVFECTKAGLGSWIDPNQASRRNTSNMFEIELFGVLGRGSSKSEAIQNWIEASESTLQGEPPQEAA